MQKLVAALLAFLSLFRFVGGPSESLWPGEDFETGRAWWLWPAALEYLYSLRSQGVGRPENDSLLVLYKGRLVYEHYGEGEDEDSLFPVFSCTKTVVAALVGIAIKEGYIESVDQRVADFYPDAAIAPGQESKLDMTVRHLLTMTSGLPQDLEEHCDDCMGAPDVGLAAFETPQAAAPGEKFLYSTNPGMQCLGGIIERRTGRSLYDYASEKLFGPLGITSVVWDTLGDGSSTAGSGIQMTARDMLRFGYLYLCGGVWDGQRLLPEGWVEQSKPGSNGYGYLICDYGDDWFLGGSYEARGYGGQWITICFSRDLVIARTSRPV